MQLYRLDHDAGRALDRSGFRDVVHRDGSSWLITSATYEHIRRNSRRGRRSLAAATPISADEERWADASSRLVIGWSAATCAPLPDNVRDEARLMLYTQPGLRVEFMGRGKVSARAKSLADTVSYLDIAGGRRHYAFRTMEGGGKSDNRLESVQGMYQRLGAWIDDPEARVVLSLGGGGFRLFAAQAAVRAIERLLGGDRSKIDEVWGSSGGAMLGYAFAHGHDLSVIEELGYKLYHGQTHQIPGLDLHTAVGIARRAIHWTRPDEVLRPEMSNWVDTVDALCPPAARIATRVPFYALASNMRRRYPVALTDPANVEDHCRDFLVGCDPGEATGASMAVPFLVNPMRGMIHGYEHDLWFDGSIAEENPIMLPFTKWMRDRKRDPQKTPKRLKLALVNLNMRFSESRTLSAIPSQMASMARRVTDLFDLLLDSKTTMIVRTLRELPEVEIFTATLQLGQMKFIARGALPSLIRSGQVVEGWQLKFHADPQPLELGGGLRTH